MMFEIEVAGRSRRVTVEAERSKAGVYRVDVEGKRRLVDLRRLGEATMSLVFLDQDGTSHVVDVVDEGHGAFVVHADAVAVRLTVNGRRGGRRPAASDAAPGERRIVAPMPGRVVRVLVSPGDEVAARQPLVVVEAMKMANEMTSPKAGRVKDVAVSEGMPVEAGRLLVVVE